MRKFVNRIITILSLLCFSYVMCAKTYSYNLDNTITHLQKNALSKSHNCCAWFVMRALNAGNCPIGILPAFAYAKALPFYGFVEIPKNAKRKVGDIVVFPAIKNHIYGHIAIWDGKQWISDFKQKHFVVAKEYSACKYKLFRHKSIDN